jgi:hypothetical protein
MSGYVLILSIISAFGSVDTQRVGSGYQTYQQCNEDAVGRVESLRPLYPDAHLRWHCERGDE